MAKTPNPEIVEYIEKHLSKGFNLGDIKKRLKDVGHPIEAVESAAAFVIDKNPHLNKSKRFKVTYGLFLIILLGIFTGFVLLKLSQHAEYEKTVSDILSNRSYIGRTNVDLLKMAAAGDMRACEFIKDHNMYYACVERYWERGDCVYEVMVGENASQCLRRERLVRAVGSENYALCSPSDSDSECFTKIALAKNDSSFCFSSESCIINFSISLYSPETCSLSSVPDDCFEEYAAFKMDDSFCAGSVDCILRSNPPVVRAEKFNQMLVGVDDKKFDDLFDELGDVYHPDFCSNLERSYKSYKFSDICFFYGGASGNAGACSMIQSDKIRACCENAGSINYINENCAFLDT